MSKSNASEEAFLRLVLTAVPWANIADNAASSPATNLYLALHTADPGEAGTQATSEAAYTGYARVAIARVAGTWTIVGGTATLNANVDFPADTAGTGTATFASVGLGASGATPILWSGAISPTIAYAPGVIPRVASGSTVTED